MSKIIDLTGQRYGRVVVVSLIPEISGEKKKWLCHCDCGNDKSILALHLRSGHTQSCGCIGTKHGERKNPAYWSYVSMLKRCYNTKHNAYKNYGGRGIAVCKRWRNSISAFISDMGPRPSPKHTIDRINNAKGYSPSNCRWATMKQQQRNRRNNRMLTYKGKTRCLSEWAELYGLSRHTLAGRINRYKWPVDKALTVRPWVGKNIKEREAGR